MFRLPRMCGAIVLFIELAIFVQPVEAAMSLSVTNIPPGVDQAQEFSADVSFLCSSCTSDSFLRGVFYPSGTSYFGFTKDNTGNWVNAPGGGCNQYFKISGDEIKEGSWSGTLQFKVDCESSFYQGPGDYLFKVGRYTSSCGAPIWSSETTIAVTGPTPTPTPAPTETPAPTPQHTRTPTPTRTPTMLPTKTTTPTMKLAVTPIPTLTMITTVSAVLGTADSPATTSVEAERDTRSSPRPMIISLLLVGIGCAMLSLVFVWKKRNVLKSPES